MRLWCVLLTGLFVLTSLAPLTVGAQECAEGSCPSDDDGPGENGQGQGNGSKGNASGNTSAENTTERGRGGPPDQDWKSDKESREQEIERRKQEARDAWREARSQAETATDERRSELLAQLPADLRDRVGQLTASEDAVHGTFVTLQPDSRLGILQQVAAADGVLFEEIYVPLGFTETASESLHGKTYRLTGEGWSFRLVDDTRAPMRFQTDSDSFLLVLPEGATATPAGIGLQIAYPAGADTTQFARITGDVAVDPADARNLIVSGTASYHLSAERPLLPQVSNQVRTSLEAALDSGRLGAETTVLRAEGTTTFVDSVLYEEMEVVLEESSAVDEGQTYSGYTITVDSESHEGKTIAVAFESGLIDPSTLVFRYFNVETDQTVEATIVQARDLADVLDPHNDGTIAEYWIVQDDDGTQVLLSIPSFSVHQIQLMSIVDVVLERPSLLIGTVGAIVLVAVATGGMFRRPEDDA